jgi:crossover junction endodeoxyribonuclease RuvC
MLTNPTSALGRILAFDPGVNGAFAVLDANDKGGSFVATGELPRFDKLLDAVGVSELLRTYEPTRAVIERVHSMPGQGVSSTFTFGASYGLLIGVAGGAGLPLTFVTPSRWKSHFRLAGKPKDASRELAIRLFPEAAGSLKLKKHTGRADALLLARFVLDIEANRAFA